MKKKVKSNPITSLLTVLTLLLSLIVGIEWLLLPYQPETVSEEKAGATLDDEVIVSEQLRYVHPPMSDFGEILSRPIFFPDRQMPEQQEEPVPVPVARTQLLLKLEGIAIAADTRVAVLRDMRSNQLVQLSVGMSRDNWLLDGLTQSKAIFRSGDEIAELTLEFDKN